MLDIVITHYKEPYEVGWKLLTMIGLQRCISFDDIRVMIVNDGGNRLPDEKLALLPYPVEQIDIQHGGISAARNAGIDHGVNPWIMFCDFDDSFANIYALRDILTTLPNDGFDMLWTQIIAEDYVDGKQLLYYTPRKQAWVFTHGKVYRRQFLIDSGLRFDEDLTFNEDSCFNAKIIARIPYQRIGQIKTNSPMYVWIRRQSSVTNSGREDEATYGHFCRNLKIVAEYDENDNRYDGMVTRTVYDTYYMLFGSRISLKMKRRILEEFVPWTADRIDHFGKVSPEILKQIVDISKLELLEPGDTFPDDFETVKKWVEGLNAKERVS